MELSVETHVHSYTLLYVCIYHNEIMILTQINTCGAGPVSNVIMTVTNMRPPTLPPPTTTASVTTTLTPSPTFGNIRLLLRIHT